jgi:hypothetical protein
VLPDVIMVGLPVRLPLVEARGEARGVARARETTRRTLDRLIALRGWSVTAEQQARIDAVDDIEVMQRWFDRVVTCATLDEALAG